MKSSVHCAIQTILNGSAKIASRWEPTSNIGMIGHSFLWDDMYRPHYPHKDYFDTPVLELYGNRWQEGILEYVYQRVQHLIVPDYYRQVSAFEPFFDGSFSYSVREWCRMMYPTNKGKDAVPQEILDKMAETGCFGNGWLDHRAVLYPQADLSMKKEFEFKKHKPNSTRKHYFVHRSQ